jgi:serine/threonine protein phosphatase PrpC
MRIEAAGQTDTGQGRLDNQDAFAVLCPPNVPHGLDAVLVVADGMGGHRGGATASKLAVEAIAVYIGALGRQDVAEAALQASAAEAVCRANAAIYEESARDPELAGMGATCTLALAAGGLLAIGHVGDSRALIASDGTIRQLTDDHSWVANEARQGRLSAAEAATHPRKNVLLRAIGPLASVEVDTLVYAPQLGDVLVLCSDGLSNMLEAAEIGAAVSQASPEAACAALIATANKRGAPDNVTAVVARMIE